MGNSPRGDRKRPEVMHPERAALRAGRRSLLLQRFRHLLHLGTVAAVHRGVLDLVRVGTRVCRGGLLEYRQVSLKIRGKIGSSLSAVLPALSDAGQAFIRPL